MMKYQTWKSFSANPQPPSNARPTPNEAGYNLIADAESGPVPVWGRVSLRTQSKRGGRFVSIISRALRTPCDILGKYSRTFLRSQKRGTDRMAELQTRGAGVAPDGLRLSFEYWKTWPDTFMCPFTAILEDEKLPRMASICKIFKFFSEKFYL